MANTLARSEARRVYNRIGSLQDSQAFYEDPATRVVLARGQFGSAAAVFEFGCGTGRFALRLLKGYLPVSASYRGVDISPRMVSIARARLAAFRPRAEIVLTDGDPPAEEPAEKYDRFVSNYVFALLSEEDIMSVAGHAHRMLRPGGLLCLADLSTGIDRVSRTVARIWTWIQARRPSLVGGCRPIELRRFLSTADWRIEHHEKVAAFGVPSEALIARRR